MRNLNFVIVGAPKAGTTSLASYLASHSKVYMPSVKEPHYFGDDLTPTHYTGNLQLYAGLFRDAANEQLIGEASTWYLYSKSAAAQIHNHSPNCKIIIMLRDPVDSVFSLHSQNLFGLNEDKKNLEDALTIESERKKGRFIPANNFRRESLFYSEVYRYSEQVCRFKNIFGYKNVHIVNFNNFINETGRELGLVFDFLGLDREPIDYSVVKNQRKTYRYLWIQKLVRSWVIRKVTNRISPVLKEKVSSRLKQINSKSVDSVARPKEVVERLRLVYEDDIVFLNSYLIDGAGCER